jgi:hypothetical protein
MDTNYFEARNKRIDETKTRNEYLGFQPDFSERVNLYSRIDYNDNTYTPDVRAVSQTGRKVGLTGLGNSEAAMYFFSNKNLEMIARKTGYENNCSFQEMLQKFFKEKLILKNVWTTEEGKRLSRLAINNFEGKNKKLERLADLYPCNIGDRQFPDRGVCTTLEKNLEYSVGFSSPEEFKKKMDDKNRLSYF